MIDSSLFRSIALQLLHEPQVEVGGQRIPVWRTSVHRLRAVAFSVDGRKFLAIEQNPEKASYWAKLARQGHRVVQFKDVAANRYVAVSVDGEVKEYRHTARQAIA